MTDRIFILATPEQAEAFMLTAINWNGAGNQHRFKDNPEVKIFAISAVAEYLANEKGFTMYRENATYPKSAD
jgi:hypothetical protein